MQRFTFQSLVPTGRSDDPRTQGQYQEAVQVVRRFGVKRVIWANQPVGRIAVDAAFDALRDPAFDLFVVADSLAVVEGLAALAERYGRPMAVATTKPTSRAHLQVEASGLLPRFVHVQGTDEGMRPKPSADVILHACRQLAVHPSEVIMVGDTARDIGAARAAGCKAVAVAYSDAHHRQASDFGADLVVRSLGELVGVSLE
jgi:phosphoglycolate phosphatase-like HAD superfamily hydrolase